MEDLNDPQTSKTLVEMLADYVSKGGNLLLNIGSTADGRIPVVIQQRYAEGPEKKKFA